MAVVKAPSLPSHAPWLLGVDQIAGAHLATNHLPDLGRETMLHLAGPAAAMWDPG